MIDYQSWADEYTEEFQKVNRIIARLKARIKEISGESKEKTNLINTNFKLLKIRKELLDVINILSERI